MKHRNEIIIEEWIDSLNVSLDKITISQLNNFCLGNRDLFTMGRCLIDPEFRDILISTENKQDYTDLTPLEAFDSYHMYPQWFLVFCPLTPQTLGFMYSRSLEISEEMIEQILVRDNYIGDLVSYGIFERSSNFYINVGVEGSHSIRDFITRVNENICSLEGVSISSAPVEKFKFFNLDQFIEGEDSSFLDYLKDIKENFAGYKEVCKFYKIEVSNVDELFFKKMPASISIDGVFNLKSDRIDYLLKQNPIDFFIDQLRVHSKSIEDFNKNKKSKVANSVFSIAKLGAAVVSGNPFLGASGAFDLIKGGLESADLVKDGYELAADTLNFMFLEEKVLEDLYGEYIDNSSQFLTFRSFFIAKTKELLYTTISKEFKLNVQIPESAFEDIYNKFFTQIVEPRARRLNMSSILENQLSVVDDKDSFLISLICDNPIAFESPRGCL